MLDPIRLPKAALSKAAKAEKKTAGKGAKPPPASSAPEIALHEIKGGGTVATLVWIQQPVQVVECRRRPRH